MLLFDNALAQLFRTDLENIFIIKRDLPAEPPSKSAMHVE